MAPKTVKLLWGGHLQPNRLVDILDQMKKRITNVESAASVQGRHIRPIPLDRRKRIKRNFVGPSKKFIAF